MTKDLHQLVEARIRAAQARGPLATTGEGQPLPPDPTAGLPEEQRFEAILARSVGGVPEEVAVLKALEALRERYDRCEDAAERERLRDVLRARAREASMMFEAGGRPLAAQRVLALAP